LRGLLGSTAIDYLVGAALVANSFTMAIAARPRHDASGPNVLQFASQESNSDSICHSIIARSLIDVEFLPRLKNLAEPRP